MILFFFCINDDLLKAGLAHQACNLTSNNVDGRAGHESTDSRRGDELDNPTQAEKTNTKNDEAGNKGYCSCYLRASPDIGMFLINMGDDL